MLHPHVSQRSNLECFVVATCCKKQGTLLKNIWDKVIKSGPSKICGRQPLKNLKEYGLLNNLVFHMDIFHKNIPGIVQPLLATGTYED